MDALSFMISIITENPNIGRQRLKEILIDKEYAKSEERLDQFLDLVGFE